MVWSIDNRIVSGLNANSIRRGCHDWIMCTIACERDGNVDGLVVNGISGYREWWMWTVERDRWSVIKGGLELSWRVRINKEKRTHRSGKVFLRCVKLRIRDISTAESLRKFLMFVNVEVEHWVLSRSRVQLNCLNILYSLLRWCFICLKCIFRSTIYEFHILITYLLHQRVYYELTNYQLPVGLITQLVR